MSCYSLTHLADHVLLRELATLNSQDRTTTAALLAHLAEVDERKLYLPAAYPSMYLYCVRELRMSEDMALMRIRVARSARQFPGIFPALADGRLNLTAVLLLTPHLTSRTADDLLATAAGKTKDEIRLQLAERFPQPDVPTLVEAMAPAPSSNELAPGPVGASIRQLGLDPVGTPDPQLGLDPVGTTDHQLAPERVAPPAPRARLAPLAPDRFAVQVTVDKDTHDQLRYAQALLGHAVPSGDVAGVLKRALAALVEKLERQKFAKCARSRPRRGAVKGRYVPAEVRRAVFQRDEGRCTFRSDGGRRCEARSRLEFDHADAVANGGQATTGNLRLRCRAHNQFAADCAFGAGFMQAKRQGVRRRADEAKAQAGAEAAAKAARQEEVIPWLRQLGFSATDARRGAALCEHFADAPLEQRVRIALRGLAPNCTRIPAPAAAGPM